MSQGRLSNDDEYEVRTVRLTTANELPQQTFTAIGLIRRNRTATAIFAAASTWCVLSVVRKSQFLGDLSRT